MLLPNVRVKQMPEKAILIYTYAKSLLTPLLGYGGYLALLQSIDLEAKSLYAIIGAVIMAILSYFAVKANAAARVQVVGIESKVKEIDVTKSADIEELNIALQLFDRGMLEAKEAREFFKEASTEQRTIFLSELKEARDHYENKEAELRQSYHDRLESVSVRCNEATADLMKIRIILSNFGITIDDNLEVHFPEGFERRKIHK